MSFSHCSAVGPGANGSLEGVLELLASLTDAEPGVLQWNLESPLERLVRLPEKKKKEPKTQHQTRGARVNAMCERGNQTSLCRRQCGALYWWMRRLHTKITRYTKSPNRYGKNKEIGKSHRYKTEREHYMPRREYSKRALFRGVGVKNLKLEVLVNRHETQQ